MFRFGAGLWKWDDLDGKSAKGLWGIGKHTTPYFSFLGDLCALCESSFLSPNSKFLIGANGAFLPLWSLCPLWFVFDQDHDHDVSSFILLPSSF